MTSRLIRIGVLVNICMALVLTLTSPAGSKPDGPTPYLGLRYTSVAPLGVRVDGVRHDSPAALAGLEIGDIIFAIGDVYINDGNFLEALAAHTPEQTVNLSIMRREQQQTLSVTLGHKPHSSATQQDLMLGQLDVQRDGLLMTSVAYDTAQAAVRVLAAEEAMVLYDAGLRAGDVILGVDDHPIDAASAEELLPYLLFQETAVLTVKRDDTMLDLTVPSRLAMLLVMNVKP